MSDGVPVNQEQLRPLLRLFALLAQWGERADQGPAEVQPGSALAATDAATEPAQTSHLVVSALAHGFDHMHALRTLLVKAQALHTYAPFSLVRAALENYATAAWLLAPDDASLRVQRRLQLAAADARRGHEVRVLLNSPVGRPLAVRLDEMAARADRAGVRRDVIFGKTPGFERIVREAGEETGMSGDAVVAVWKLCSGIAHGQLWASYSVLERQAIGVGDDEGLQSFRLSASERYLVQASQVTMGVGRQAWRLYDRRRLHWRQHEAPPR